MPNIEEQTTKIIDKSFETILSYLKILNCTEFVDAKKCPPHEEEVGTFKTTRRIQGKYIDLKIPADFTQDHAECLEKYVEALDAEIHIKASTWPYFNIKQAQKVSEKTEEMVSSYIEKLESSKFADSKNCPPHGETKKVVKLKSESRKPPKKIKKTRDPIQAKSKTPKPNPRREKMTQPTPRIEGYVIRQSLTHKEKSVAILMMIMVIIIVSIYCKIDIIIVSICCKIYTTPTYCFAQIMSLLTQSPKRIRRTFSRININLRNRNKNSNSTPLNDNNSSEIQASSSDDLQNISNLNNQRSVINLLSQGY